MSEDGPEHQKMVEEAAGIFKASNGKIKLVDAMKLVGFSQEQTRVMRVYQQVRRKAQKLTIIVGSLVVGGPSSNSNVSTLTASEEQTNSSSTTDTSIQSVRRRLLDTPPTVATTPPARGSAESSSGRGSSTGSVSKSPAKGKKTRRSSKEVQRIHAAAARKAKRDRAAMKQATVLVHRSNQLPKGDPKKKSMRAIVDETNERFSSSLSSKTVGRYVRQGIINQSPLKRGPVGDFAPRIYNALKGAYSTYLKLEQASCREQSSVKKMAKLVNTCVNRAGMSKSREDLTRKLKKDTADQFDVGKANVVEARRLYSGQLHTT